MAIINWLFARKHNGQFLLRIDDTDQSRSQQTYIDGILEDLHWLGLDHDEIYYQSAFMDRYWSVLRALEAKGLVYPCYETAEELEYMRKRSISQGKPPLYNRTALTLSDRQKQAFEKEGRLPHWRFKLRGGPIGWEDLNRGRQSFLGENLSDPILVRGDGTFLYSFPSVINDFDMNITHVIRGEDHITNTAVQICMYEEIAGKCPQFAHISLMSSLLGEGFSKREGSASIRAFRQEGIEPLSLLHVLGFLGTALSSHPPESSLEDMLGAFGIDKYAKSSPKFDPKDVLRANQHLLQKMPFEDMEETFRQWGLTQAKESFWEAIRPNITKREEVKLWYRLIFEPEDHTKRLSEEEKAFVAIARKTLPPEPWSSQTWQQWVETIQKETGRRGKNLFMPLRHALTGQDYGPDLKDLLPLLGYDRVRKLLVA